MAAPQDIVVPEAPSDVVSDLHFAPGQAASDYLAATAWDGSCSVWEIAPSGECVPRARNKQPAPLLSCSWSGDRQRVAMGGCEGQVKVWSIGTNSVQVLGAHKAPVKIVRDLSAVTTQANAPTIMSASWDKTVKYWDPRSTNGEAALTVDLPDKAYAADQLGQCLAVCTAERHVLIYDLRKPSEPYKQLMSPLKFQTRCITLFPTADGFALGSIEGRVAIQHLHDDQAAKNFAFKCHRQGETVHAVNAIVFHPVHGTFATVGGDGAFTFWDKESKQRLKAFPAQKNAVLAADFNPSGSMFSYAIGYDFSGGAEKMKEKEKPMHIALHAVLDADIARRPKPDA